MIEPQLAMLGYPELLFIFLIVLLLFGGAKIPELARSLGRGIREFQKAKDGLKDSIDDSLKEDDKKTEKKEEEKKQSDADSQQKKT